MVSELGLLLAFMRFKVLPLHHIAQPARVSSTAAFSREIVLVEEVRFSEEDRRR